MVKAGQYDWLLLDCDSGQFSVDIVKPAQNTDITFQQAARQAIECLANDYCDRPLYLALSGGIDSELVANLLVEKKIAFTPVILKINSINQAEFTYAELWCHRHNIQPNILEISIDQYVQLIKKYYPLLMKLNNLSQTPILYLYEYVTGQNGYCIYAAGDINLDFEKKEFFCYSLDFISDVLQNGHPTSFFMYTAELALSYVKEFDVDLPEQDNKLKFYGVLPRSKFDYLTPLHKDPRICKVIDNCCYLAQKTIVSQPYWYGTKTQLIEKLHGKKML